MSVDDQVSGLRELLSYYREDLEGPSLIVVTRDRIRIRRSQSSASDG